MRSWQIVDWGKPLEARDYPDPQPQGSEVLLKVDACGVCHTDLHLHDGYFDLGGGEALRVAAHEGPIPAHPVGQGPALVRGTPPGRAVLDRRTIHVTDVQAEAAEYPEGAAHAPPFVIAKGRSPSVARVIR